MKKIISGVLVAALIGCAALLFAQAFSVSLGKDIKKKSPGGLIAGG